MRKTKLTVGLALTVMLSVLVASCATTPRGKAQQGSQVVVQMGQAILKACTESKAKEWKPLSKDVCAKLTAAYDVAWDGSKRALDLTAADPNAVVPMAILTQITDFVLYAYDVLTAAKIVVPPSATAFVKKTQDSALQ